jgi:hypothetical protein
LYKVILLNGSAEAGKGTFVDAVKALAAEDGLIVCNPSTVNSVKLACSFMGAQNEPKTDKKRRLWNKVKAAWTEFNDGPFRESLVTIDALNKSGHHIVFLDVREPSELEKYRDHFGDECLALLLTNPRPPVPDNDADQHVNDFQYDHTIENHGGLKALNEAARIFYNLLMEKRHEVAA